MTDRFLRLRAFLDKQFAVVVAVLVVLALVGGWVTYTTHATPDTTTEERTVSSWSVTGEYDHSATVTDENPVVPVGTTLSNRSVYITAIAPVVTGTFTFQYEASDGGELDVAIEERAVVQSVDTQQDDATVVWNRSRSLERRSSDSVEPDSAVAVPFSINVSEERNRTEQVQEALGDPPGEPQLAIVTTVTFRGTVNDQEVDQTRRYVLPITFEDGAYRLNATTATQQFETTETVVVEQQPGALEAVGGPILLVLGLGSAGLLGVLYRRDQLALSESEREYLEFDDDRDEFGEWINRMTLRDEMYERQQVRADSLADLVDFAIDTNNSVIEDDGYYVLHDGLLYTYEPPQAEHAGSDSSPTERTDESAGDDEDADGESAAAED